MSDISTMTGANTILSRSFAQEHPINLMKLQYILYVVSTEHSKSTDEQMLGERFLVRKHGPELSSLDYKFGCFNGRNIDRYAKDVMGGAFTLADSSMLVTFDRVWKNTYDVSATMLSRILTQPGSAWYNARQERLDYIPETTAARDTSYQALLGL